MQPAGRAILGIAMTMPFAIAGIATLTGDTYTAAESPDSVFGAQERIVVDAGRQGLFQFQLPNASGRALRSATLTLFAHQVTRAGTINIAPLAGRWSEASVTRELQPGTRGPVITNVAVNQSQQYVAVDVTAIVKAWLEGTPNQGLLISAGAQAVSVAFDSKENLATSHPAQLELNWTESPGPAGPAGPPGPAGAAGPTGPRGLPGPAGLNAMEVWASRGLALDLRRIALRRWGVQRGPLFLKGVSLGTLVPQGTTPPKPLAIETDGEAVYLLETHSLTKIRAVDGETIWSRPVSGYGGSGWESGAGLLHDGGYLWRVHGNGDGLTQANPVTGEGLAGISLTETPRRIAFDGQSLWTGSNQGVRKIAHTGSIAQQTQAILATNSELGVVSALVWDGESIWAAVPAEGVVARLSPSAAVVEKHVVCPATPGSTMPGMAFDGSAIWASCGETGLLARWNTGRDGQPKGLMKIDAGGGIGQVEFDGASLWVIRTNENGPLFVRVSKSGDSVEPITWPGFAQPLLLRFDGLNLWSVMHLTMPGAISTGALVKF